MRASERALASHQKRSEQHPGEQCDQHRRGNRATEEQAHHAGQLHVAHAHATWIGHRSDQKRPACHGAGDQPLRLAARVECGSERNREDRAERRQLVGDDAVLDVDQCDRDEQQDEGYVQSDRCGAAAGKHRTHAQQSSKRLHQRIAL